MYIYIYIFTHTHTQSCAHALVFFPVTVHTVCEKSLGVNVCFMLIYMYIYIHTPSCTSFRTCCCAYSVQKEPWS